MSQDKEINNAVKEGGAYDIIKKRLSEQSNVLNEKAENLNEKRKKAFGGIKNEIIGKTNIRTDNNCVPVDIVQINNQLLLGYKVNIGLKQNLNIDDVLGLYEIEEIENGYRTNKISFENTFLNNSEFIKDFNELMTYYKGAHLVQIVKDLNFLLVFFRIGNEVRDLKVFKFSIGKTNEIKYLDDKGLEGNSEFRNFDFEWIKTTRDNHILGKHSHISINDKLFVETIGGDLTIKIENNTDDGLGIYRESVDDPNQGLEEADIYYAESNSFILLKIKPYRENAYRYFIFNKITQDVVRIDEVGDSCLFLPEEQGVIFPSGYYLTNGEYKTFDINHQKFNFFNKIISPNGEDYLFVFFEPKHGFYLLYSYNIITKELQNPIPAHGYGIYDNGEMVVFKESENSEASKIHPLRIWQTPFCSEIYFSQKNESSDDVFLTNIGNAELVRAISEIYSIVQYINKKEVSNSLYEGIISQGNKILNEYHWVKNEQAFSIAHNIEEIISTAELIIDEFEKVKTMQDAANKELEKTNKKHDELINKIKLVDPSNVSDHVDLLKEINSHLGQLISIKEKRYINKERIDDLKKNIESQKELVNDKLLNLLKDKKAFDSYFKRIEESKKSVENASKVIEFESVEEKIKIITDDITVISEEVNEIKVKDATITAQILDTVSEVFAKLNQIKAITKNKKKKLLSIEAKAEFASQFKLLSQSVSSALTTAETPDSCDEQMARLMSQVESLESKFANFDEYLEEIFNKREEIQAVFETHKEQLLSAIQKRIANFEKAADITLNSINKKVEKFDKIEDLNSYFASDLMVLKIKSIVEEIIKLGDTVKADDIDSRLKKIKDKSLRALRDNKDIFEDGGKIMKMGKHRFNVNKKDFGLTIVPKNEKLAFHLTSTDFYESIENEEFNNLKDYWNMDVMSESKSVYRGEFLAYSILKKAESQSEDFNLEMLYKAVKENKLIDIVKSFSSTRYKEGYIKGVHDEDAALILNAVLDMYNKAGILKFSQKTRAITLLYTLFEYKKDKIKTNELFKNIKNNEWKNAKFLANNFGDYKEISRFINEKSLIIKETLGLKKDEDANIKKMANYFGQMVFVLGDDQYKIEVTKNALDCAKEFLRMLKNENISLIKDNENLINNYNIVKTWIFAFVKNKNNKNWEHFIDEASAIYLYLINKEIGIDLIPSQISLTATVENIIGQHQNIINGKINVTLDKFLEKCEYHEEVVIPNFEKMNGLKKKIVENEKKGLQLDSFKANPLSSFVRNKLITTSYIPLIGDNFAKQMGTVGENKRTDSNGMLLLISPPGYGKTTLIEYVANKLGLIFMKINCPSLSHKITSLDPNEAPDATSKKELEKINLAFEMGNNVLLYLDDIQHTNPEFLQKFISLCDGTRKIDGVWKNEPKTYDMKGKKFAIIMAGNPYTESGEVFKIPDMLANRADIYNLGEMLSGQKEAFELSYIENALTSNPVLTPLATRSLEDLYKFIDMAKGKEIPLNELEHSYSSAEKNEIVNLLKNVLKIQKLVLRVNKEYIKSASVANKYRVEPAFKLQGSYRNTNKMVEKLFSVMNDEEVYHVILDHYLGEAQTLSSGTEENLLKLKEILNVMTDEEKKRWESIKVDFIRNKETGGEDADGSIKIANQLLKINESMKEKKSWEDSLALIVENMKKEYTEVSSLQVHMEELLTRIKKIEATEVKDEYVILALKKLHEYLTLRTEKQKS